MDVILRQAVEKLGQPGDVVKVSAGFARNYLLPRGIAYAATAGNLKRIEREKARLQAAGIKPRLMRRANKHDGLSPRMRHYNRLIARRRAAVETTFATLKQRMKLRLIRYRGLPKAAAQITLAAIAFNLRRWAALTG